MRLFLLPTLTPILMMASLFAFAGQPASALREDPEVVVTDINAKANAIRVKGKYGSGMIRVGPKTWIAKDDDEAKFADLRVEQRLRVRFIQGPQGSQAVTLEVLPEKGFVAGRPVYAVREYREVIVSGINAKTKAIGFQLPRPSGGYQYLRVSPKTRIIKDDQEGTFADLRVGQRLHVWFIARGGQAVMLEVCRTSADERT
jgi:hypothetical protein